MTRERPGATPGPSSSPDHPTADLRRSIEGRVVEVLVWHPEVAAGLVDRIDPDLFLDPIYRELVGQVLDVYKTGVDLGSGTVLEAVSRQYVSEAFRIDRPTGTAAAVWAPNAVADLTYLDRATAIRAPSRPIRRTARCRPSARSTRRPSQTARRPTRKGVMTDDIVDPDQPIANEPSPPRTDDEWDQMFASHFGAGIEDVTATELVAIPAADSRSSTSVQAPPMPTPRSPLTSPAGNGDTTGSRMLPEDPEEGEGVYDPDGWLNLVDYVELFEGDDDPEEWHVHRRCGVPADHRRGAPRRPPARRI